LGKLVRCFDVVLVRDAGWIESMEASPRIEHRSAEIERHCLALRRSDRFPTRKSLWYACVTLSKLRPGSLWASALRSDVGDWRARATGRPLNEVAIDDMVEHVDRLDDLHLAERRLAELRTGKAQAISLDEVMTRYS
jgi:RHH-type rel operon transcriptional repressor/antitoxin RelB